MRAFEHKVYGILSTLPGPAPWSPPGVSLLAARRMWTSTRGEGMVVAILDTGVDYDHPDLNNRIIAGTSFISTEKDFRDENGHGTHVAGTIAANKVILGVAPESRLLAIKVLNKYGYGSYQGIVNGLEWARKWRGRRGERVNVINLSLGGPLPVPAIHREIKKVVKAGISVICAAGNSGDGKKETREISYPAYYPETVAVGAVNLQTGAANFSNSNDQIDIVAPGVDTYSTYPGGKYVKLSGTSMAAPHISGASALIYSRYKKRFGAFPDPATVYRLLQYLSIDLGEAGYDELYGFGLFSFNPDGGKGIRLKAGSPRYLINGKEQQLQQAPLLRGGGLFAAVGELSELLGADHHSSSLGEEEIWT